MSIQVFVVEDEPKVERFVRAALEREGMHVESSSDIHDILELLGKLSYDVLVMDRMLGHDDSIQILPKVRKQFPKLKILILSALGDSSQKANADITVEPIFEPGGAIEVQTKLLTLIAAGEAPDAYWAHSYTNAGQSKRDIQMDITSMMATDNGLKAEDFLAAAWNDFTVDGKQVGIPRETTSTVIIYNKELFDKHSLPLPNENWTWDDFTNAAATITEGEGAEKIFGTADWNLNRNTWIRMWQNGGDVLNAVFLMPAPPCLCQ